MKVDDLPPHEDYWAVPVPRSIGDENGDAIYSHVGIALTKWETIEIFFSLFFGTLVESKSSAAQRAYGSISSARGRREALEAAAEVFFLIHRVHEEDSKRFKRIMKHFTRASSRRNEIATQPWRL